MHKSDRIEAGCTVEDEPYVDAELEAFNPSVQFFTGPPVMPFVFSVFA